MSRLDEIRKGIEAGGCDQCEGAAELLAVVDALIDSGSLSKAFHLLTHIANCLEEDGRIADAQVIFNTRDSLEMLE